MWYPFLLLPFLFIFYYPRFGALIFSAFLLIYRLSDGTSRENHNALTNKILSNTEAETILEELISSAINKRILCRQDWIGLSSFDHNALQGSKNSFRIENGFSRGLLLKS